MRTGLMLTAAALALTACGPKTTTDNSADMNLVATDNMMVAPNDGMENGAMANGAMSAAVSTPEFVKNAALGDMYEIASSKLAATSATSAGIKTFAAEMITAHTATTAGLKAAIAKDGVKDAPPAALDAEHQSLIDALKATKGDAFDALYKSQQIDAHNKTLALMEGYALGGDQPALKAFASDTAPKVKAHLDMLNKM